MMKISPEMQRMLFDLVDRKRDRLVQIARDLIRIPSENTPPTGREYDCQAYLSKRLHDLDLTPDLYDLHDVPDLEKHPLFHPGRDYRQRPNLAARRKGAGGGRSLLLTGHIDTVPSGTQEWTRDPFGGELEDGRIYGRGANDMKAGIASNLFVMECIQEIGLPLAGDVLFETVVDEEFGGSNGTLAGRLRGVNADAAIISEPSSLRICPAQRGGRTAHIRFHAPGGILHNGLFPQGVIPQITHFLSNLGGFAARRRSHVRVHEMYADYKDPVPVSVTKIFTSPWGFGEPITVPETGHLELYWQLMPSELQSETEQEFFDWFHHLVETAPEIYPESPEVTFPLRWLPGSSILRTEPIVESLSACAAETLGAPPRVAGIEGPCDLYIFQRGFGIPAVAWGVCGGNTHAADEYVEIDSLVAAAKSLLLLIPEWCGLA
ncbi:MAG TPA: M20/M25/M40 family metallo-hydrolase [Bryobacteraceae bacterium]|nr:M20/M25/M40 family metallo-hydrolase [Bryobacteraceae bacterium]